MTITADSDLRAELDLLDMQILASVRERIDLTRRAGIERLATGTPRVAHRTEMDVLRRFEAQLGRDGLSLGMLLLRLARTGVPVQ